MSPCSTEHCSCTRGSRRLLSTGGWSPIQDGSRLSGHPALAFCTLMLGWALTGIFHTSPVSSHQLHPSSHLAGACLEREQRGAGAAGRCRRAPLLLATKIDAAQLRALPEQLLALPRSLLLFFLSIKRRCSSSGPLLPRVGELCQQGDADPAAQDAATRPLRGANPTPELGGSDCSAPSPSAALFSAATTALARCTQLWAPATPVPLFWKDFFVICNTAGCRRGCRAGARWLRLGCSGSSWMVMSPGLRDPAVCSNPTVCRGCRHHGALQPVPKPLRGTGTCLCHHARRAAPSAPAGAWECSLLCFPAN